MRKGTRWREENQTRRIRQRVPTHNSVGQVLPWRVSKRDAAPLYAEAHLVRNSNTNKGEHIILKMKVICYLLSFYFFPHLSHRDKLPGSPNIVNLLTWIAQNGRVIEATNAYHRT